MNQSHLVVFLGKLGHGKTRLVNFLCGTEFTSAMSAASCTTTLQIGKTLNYQIEVIDTPGFVSSDSTTDHTSCQIKALEARRLSGVYIVVKYGRVDEMAETAGMVMDFADTEEPCIIVTFADDILSPGCDRIVKDATMRLACLLGIPGKNILVIGLDSDRDFIEQFIHDTLLDPPRSFQVSSDFRAYANTLQVGARKSIVYLMALCDESEHVDDTTVEKNFDRLLEIVHTSSPEERYFLVSKLQAAVETSSESIRERLQMVLDFASTGRHATKRLIETSFLTGQSASKKLRTGKDDVAEIYADENVRDHRSVNTRDNYGIGVVKVAGEKQTIEDSQGQHLCEGKKVLPLKQSLFPETELQSNQLEKGQCSKTMVATHETSERSWNSRASDREWVRDLDGMERGEILRTPFQNLSLEEDSNLERKPTTTAKILVISGIVCLSVVILTIGIISS